MCNESVESGGSVVDSIPIILNKSYYSFTVKLKTSGLA